LESLNNENIISYIDINNSKINLDFDLGYLIGFILGDGWIGENNRIVITQKHLNVGDIWNKTVRFCNKFNYMPRKYFDDTIWRINIANKELYNIFTYFIKLKRENKQINNFFLNTPKNFREGILEGYRFSDGRKNKENGDQIRTISKTLRKQLLLIASSLGYDISYLESQKPSIGSFNHLHELFNGMYYFFTRSHSRFGFMKKLNITHVYKEPIKDKSGRFISNKQNIIPFICLRKTVGEKRIIISKKRFFDLSVIGELFLINGGIVSHNCWINFGRALSGRTSPPADMGSFTGTPIPNAGSFRTGIWQHLKHHLGGKMYYMAPNKDIQPHNFIERSLSVMLNKIRELIK